MLVDYSIEALAYPISLVERQWPLKGKQWHRHFVGSVGEKRWTAMGLAQLELLKKHGMTPSSTLLDVGCGSLRFGVHAIPFLEPGRYIGLDVAVRLIRMGIKLELSRVDGWCLRRPRFVVTDDFSLEDIGDEEVDFAIAQSVFTHLGPRSIERCLKSVMPRVKECFLASFNEGIRYTTDPGDPVYPHMVTYPKGYFMRLAKKLGITCTYIGAWGIPQNKKKAQMMLKFCRQE